MKRLLIVLVILWMAPLAWAQVGGGQTNVGGGALVQTFSGVPSGTCSAAALAVNTTNGNLYSCLSGVWTIVSGGGGTPGGSTTQIQYNNAGAFGGISGATTDGTNLSVTTQAASDNSSKTASTAYVTTGISNAIAAVNPAVAVQAASATVLPNSPTYSNGVAGVGATLTAGSAAALVVDGYTPILLNRILVKNQASAFQNGVYFLSTLGTGIVPYVLTRALDYNQPSDMNNTGAIPVVNGTVNAVTSWLQSSTVNTVGTDAVTFTQFSINPSVVTQTIASGTATLGTSAISSGACASVVTISAPGTLTTSSVIADFNADPTSTTGYVPGTMLTIIKYPTANNVNFLVCNNTGSTITPAAITINWKVF
jgi:hypothetical protein